MGGLNAIVWAAAHPTRIASLTLIAPAVDVAVLIDYNPAVLPELGQVWCGDPQADASTVLAATAAIDPARNPCPVADRTVVVAADDDSICPTAATRAWAAAAQIPTSRQVWTPTGGHGARRPSQSPGTPGSTRPFVPTARTDPWHGGHRHASPSAAGHVEPSSASRQSSCRSAARDPHRRRLLVDFGEHLRDLFGGR